MIKYFEITMASGKQYFLIATEDNKLYKTDIDAFMYNGKTLRVHTENSLTSGTVYINPSRIESIKTYF